MSLWDEMPMQDRVKYAEARLEELYDEYADVWHDFFGFDYWSDEQSERIEEDLRGIGAAIDEWESRLAKMLWPDGQSAAE